MDVFSWISVIAWVFFGGAVLFAAVMMFALIAEGIVIFSLLALKWIRDVLFPRRKVR